MIMRLPASVALIFYRASTYKGIVAFLLAVFYVLGLFLFFGLFSNPKNTLPGNATVDVDGNVRLEQPSAEVDEKGVLRIDREVLDEAASGPLGALRAASKTINDLRESDGNIRRVQIED